MKCPRCGTKNDDLAHNCVSCGEELPQETGRSQKRGSKKLIAVIAGIGAALVVLVVVLAMLMKGGSSSGGSFDMVKREILMPVFEEDEIVSFVYGGQKVDCRMDAEDAEEFVDWETSMDGKSAIFTFREDEDTILYLYSADKMLQIAENPQQYVMAQNGAAVAYLTEDDDLYLYRTAKKGAEKIADNTQIIHAISPDGKSVAYVDYDSTTYIYNDGKSRKLGEEVGVLSVSDGAKYIYGVAEDEDDDDILCLNLYSTKGFVAEVSDKVDIEAGFYTNAAHTQLIFQLESGKWYAVEKKEERRLLGSADELIPLAPEFTQQYTYSLTGLQVLGVESLNNMAYVFRTYGESTAKISYINSEWSASVLAKKVEYNYGAQYPQLNAKGTVLYYLKGDELYCVDVKDGAQTTKLAEEVIQFVVDGNGAVYYLDEYDTLCYVKKGKDAKEIWDEDVEELYVTHDGVVLMVSDDALYSVSKGSVKKKPVVEDFVDGMLVTYSDCTYYAIADEDEIVLYAATEGVKFKKLGTLLA